MIAAYGVKVSDVLVARCLLCRGRRHDKFHAVPGITVLVKFKTKREAQEAVEYLPSRASLLGEDYFGAQEIASEGHSAKDCTNELMNSQKLKNNTSIRISVGHWQKSTTAVAETVFPTSEIS